MKKLLFLSLNLCLVFSLFSQETVPQDALRLAVTPLTGTARFKSMSGAFGAVGGDLSAINVNPAGSIYFNTNQFTITSSVYNTKNDSNYFGTNTSQCETRFDLNQMGTVFVYTNYDRNQDWTKFTFAINYDNTTNFHNSIFSAGVNPSNSIGNYFLNFAQGVPLSTLSGDDYYQLSFPEQQAYLGYQTYIFDPYNNTPSNDQYYTNVPSGNYSQQNQVNTWGYNGKVVTNFAASFRNIVSFGLNLNFHFVNFSKDSAVYESNNNSAFPTGTTIRDIYFQNQLYTSGSAFSLNVGTIIRPIDNMRIGIAYESPTWYDLTDQLIQGVSTHSINNPGNESSSFYTYPIVYLPYSVDTPGKWTGSLAYIYKKAGLVSFDIISRNYANTHFGPENDPLYRSLNNYMSSALKNALEYRIGGEYRMKQVSFRGGYRFEQSPYKDTAIFGDLNGISCGIGYSFGPSRFDFSYSHDHRNYQLTFLSSGMTDPARISTYRNDYVLTYTINF